MFLKLFRSICLDVGAGQPSPAPAGQVKPGRSRSLDGLLDGPEVKEQLAAAAAGSPLKAQNGWTMTEYTTPSHPQATQSCDELDTKRSLSSSSSGSTSAEDDRTDVTSTDEKSSVHSESSESKRKRNFMDRCVNRMRSLIRI
nr:unnamed protein product [Callosobruchus chinensis]